MSIQNIFIGILIYPLLLQSHTAHAGPISPLETSCWSALLPALCVTDPASFRDPNSTKSTTLPWPVDFTPCIDRLEGWNLDPKCLCWNCDMLWDTGTVDQQPIRRSISITLGNEQRAHSSAFQGKKKNSQQHKLSKFMINKSATPVLAVLGLLDGEPPPKKRIRSKWAVLIFDVHARPQS